MASDKSSRSAPTSSVGQIASAALTLSAAALTLIGGITAVLTAGIDAVLPRIVGEGDLHGYEITVLVVAHVAALGGISAIALLYGRTRGSEAIAAQRRSDEARAATQRILDTMDEGVLLADIRQPGAALAYVNPAFEQITGYSVSEAVGKNCRYLQGNDRLQPEISEIRAAIDDRRAAKVTLRNYRKDGALFWNELRLTPVFGQAGEATHYIGLMRDVTELKEATSQLDEAGHIDRLTLVANRYFFYDKVAAFLSAQDAGPLLIVKLDVARFHEINSSYGFEAGDLLLKQIATRLNTIWKGCVGRLGADEFAIAVALGRPAEAEAVISEVCAVLQPNFVLPEAKIYVRFAVGFTLGARGEDPMTLVRQAGVALQESRRSRLREVHGFDSRTDANIKSRVRLAQELRQAVKSEDFVLYYQPKVELVSGTIIGAEALIRWRHPLFGLQPPNRFIPAAEETGLILEIGRWVLYEAARFAARINQDRSPALTISVNVSQLQFTAGDMAEQVRAVLQETGADPAWLILELTESLFADDSPEMVASFRRLRDMGLGLSIDDFGTGYSSLRYLERFPVSEIKLDKSFVQDLHQSQVKRIIVDAVIKLGAELNISVTAEGVETEAERATLREVFCLYAQGYLFGRPVASDEFLSLVGL
jgi:PAS domain S-box-containing protein/diguanylate cyclase (GGDEF)-like protein